MQASPITRVGLAAVLSSLSASVALAGGAGHGGGAAFRPAGLRGAGFRGVGGFHGGMRVSRGVPPIAGVIHERAGTRPYFSAYGHTGTAARFGGFGRGGFPAYGRTTASPFGAERNRPYAAGYGHLGTGIRPAVRDAAGFGAGGRVGARGEGRRRFAERGGFGLYGGVVGGGFGGLGYGDGTYGAPGIYGDAGVYGGQGTYGSQGTYGQPGTYGGGGTYATQSVYGNGGGFAYRSEIPLAVRFAEPPLGPSPYAAYSPSDRYAYAASEDVGPARRLAHRRRADASECACDGRHDPVVYRYGIGTAY